MDFESAYWNACQDELLEILDDCFPKSAYYRISNYLNESTCCATAINPITTTNPTKTMNFLEKAKIEEFTTNAKKVKALKDTITELEKASTLFNAVTRKIGSLSNSFTDTIDMLEHFVDQSSIEALEAELNRASTLVSVITKSGILKDIKALATKVGIAEEKDEEVTDAEMAKALGIKL